MRAKNSIPGFAETPHVGMREWRWPRAGRIKFSHLQFDSTVYDWQGAQITLICFDELTHFTAHQFFYMVSRNRSTCGVRPYIRATCNPDADSWVADFLVWWINSETGLPIPSGPACCAITSASRRRPSGLIGPRSWCNTSYSRRTSHRASSRRGRSASRLSPRPCSTIQSCCGPTREYYTWLLSLPTLERERLLGGDWKIRPAAGLYFKREWCAIVDEVPADLDVVRYSRYPPPKRPSATIPIGRSASSWAATVGRLLPARSGARAGQPGRCRAIAAQHRRAGRQSGPLGSARIRGRPTRARRCISRARSTASP